MLKDLRKVLLETITDPFSRFIAHWDIVETAAQLLEERTHNLGKFRVDDLLDRLRNIQAEKEAAEIRVLFGIPEIVGPEEDMRDGQLADTLDFFVRVSAAFEIFSLAPRPELDFKLPQEFFDERDARDKMRQEWRGQLLGHRKR